MANSVPPTRWFLSKRFTVVAACWLRFFQGLVACRAVLHRTVKLKLCCMRVLFASACTGTLPAGPSATGPATGCHPAALIAQQQQPQQQLWAPAAAVAMRAPATSSKVLQQPAPLTAASRSEGHRCCAGCRPSCACGWCAGALLCGHCLGAGEGGCAAVGPCSVWLICMGGAQQ